MEIIGKVIQQQGLQERSYVDRTTNQPAVFKSVGLIIRSGRDNLYCEAVQSMADSINQYPITQQVYVKANVSFVARSYLDSQGKERWQTECRLDNIVEL